MELARKAGHCLVRGQLRSGGWDYRIVFGEQKRERYAYRVDKALEGKRQSNTSTLDDNTTQAALRLLMAPRRDTQTVRLGDSRSGDCRIENPARRAVIPLEPGLSDSTLPPIPTNIPCSGQAILKPGRERFPKEDYRDFYTFNDNAISDVIDVMFEAADVYQDPRYREAAERAGNFMLLAQMPEPQPGWAQQYDREMHPAWARKFEPPLRHRWRSRRSHACPDADLSAYGRPEVPGTDFLAPSTIIGNPCVPTASLVRFYELKTNRPLYFTKDYQLTYSDADMPTHYSFVMSNWIASVEREFKRVSELPPDDLLPKAKKTPRKASQGMEKEVRAVLGKLDDQGRWVESGRLKYYGDSDPTERVIDCRTFVANVRALASYLATEE